MATSEDEVKDLREKNNELVQKVQYWKMTAAQKENEKLALMKENNDLRLKLSRLRNSGGIQARKLDTALQAASEKALSHLVKASAEIAKSMDIAKAYIRERQELDLQSPRWSTLSGTPSSEKKEKVHRVPPMMGGLPIQPVVALSRTLFNTGNNITTMRSANQNRNVTERAVPMHVLQDVYIPLTRIDVSELQNHNMETDNESNNAGDSADDLGLDDSGERLDEQMSDDEDFEGRRLHMVAEDLEPEDEVETPPRNRLENPLEGPSWLLDTPAAPDTRISGSRTNLEPDSTTEMEDGALRTSAALPDQRNDEAERCDACQFSPTVRRRKRTSSPTRHYSPRPSTSRRASTSGRVLKVLVAKMRLDGDASPPKRGRSPLTSPMTSPMTAAAASPTVLLVPFDAPSPNGATDSAVIVSETRKHRHDKEPKPEPRSRRESRDSQRSQHSQRGQKPTYNKPVTSSDDQHRPILDDQRPRESRTNESQMLASFDGSRQERMTFDSRADSRVDSNDSRDSDSGSGGAGDSISQGRTRRPRKTVTYKEKPLNRKMRR